MIRISPNETGQIALIVLLVMVVMLTLGISVAQRGVTDVRISQQEEDSARAFQAAETGVEEALSALAAGNLSGEIGADTSYNVTVAAAGSTGFTSGQPLAAGEVMQIDLADASANLSSVNIYWMEQGKDDCSTLPAAIEAGIVYTVGNQTRIRRAGYDTLARTNGFEAVTSGSYSFDGKVWCGKASLSLTGNDEEIRLRPVYAKAMMGVEPQPAGATLGQQYFEVESVGKTVNVSRAVVVKRSQPQLPSIFDYALFSGGGIVKGE